MRVHLLGTGASSGWPNPWCGCASCRAAAAAGLVRGQTSALVDGRLMLDVGPDAPRAALRQGTDLTGVEAVLVSHVHTDHHLPEAWMWRGWAPDRRPLVLAGPPAVLRAARPRLDDSVTTVELAAGDRVTLAGYYVVALPSRHGGASVGPALLYDVTGPDGTRLLWGTDTAALPDAALDLVQDRDYDAVLLELTGAMPDVHLDLRSWPEQVAELRRRGAVTERTQLLAVHLGHDNPPPAELDAVLAGWGGRAGVDGEVLDLAAPASPAPAPARRTLVLGGAGSGGSAHAAQLLAAEPAVTCVAPAPPGDSDADGQARAARRPAAWTTRETGDVAAVLRAADGAVLVDDLGLWVTRLLEDGAVPERVDAAVDDLVDAWRATRARAVLVCPDAGSEVVPASGDRRRDLLDHLTARLAAASDDVVQVVAGLPRSLR